MIRKGLSCDPLSANILTSSDQYGSHTTMLKQTQDRFLFAIFATSDNTSTLYPYVDFSHYITRSTGCRLTSIWLLTWSAFFWKHVPKLVGRTGVEPVQRPYEGHVLTVIRTSRILLYIGTRDGSRTRMP